MVLYQCKKLHFIKHASGSGLCMPPIVRSMGQRDLNFQRNKWSTYDQQEVCSRVEANLFIFLFHPQETICITYYVDKTNSTFWKNLFGLLGDHLGKFKLNNNFLNRINLFLDFVQTSSDHQINPDSIFQHFYTGI